MLPGRRVWYFTDLENSEKREVKNGGLPAPPPPTKKPLVEELYYYYYFQGESTSFEGRRHIFRGFWFHRDANNQGTSETPRPKLEYELASATVVFDPPRPHSLGVPRARDKKGLWADSTTQRLLRG